MLCCVSHACVSVTNASNARSPLIYEPGDVRLTDSFALLPGLAPDSAWCRTSSVATCQRQQRMAMAGGLGFSENDLYGFPHEFGDSIAGTLTFRVLGADVRQRPCYESLGW